MMKGLAPWMFVMCGGLLKSSGELGHLLKSGNVKPSY